MEQMLVMTEPDSVEVRELKAALARAVDELEEQRVAAIELRMLLDASEARLRTMGAELGEALAAAREADERREAARVESIEMRVILDATEHRVAKLEEGIGALERERDALLADCDRLKAEQSNVQEERRALESLLQEATTRLDEGERAVSELQSLGARVAEQDAELGAARARHRQELEAERARHTQELEAALERQRQELESERGRHGHELEAAELEAQRLRAELAGASESAAAAATQLASAQSANAVMEQRVRELESRPPAPRPAESNLRLAGGAAAHSPADESDALEDLSAAAELGVEERASTAPIAGVTLVHLDDRLEYRQALESAVGQFPGLRYVCSETASPSPVGGPCLVVANLFAAAGDPLAAVAAAEQWGASEIRALTYCADGQRGVVLGTVEYFPEPFDANTCAARIVADGIQRLLMVSDDIELTNLVRITMGRFQCSTSVALDARQAYELAALVRPEFVLVDLGLPRGEGLRVVARLRADPKTAALPAALLWNRHIEPSDLRSYAARVARDTLLSPDDLRRVVVAALSNRSLHGDGLRETA